MKKSTLILALVLITPSAWSAGEFVNAQPGAKATAASIPKDQKTPSETKESPVAATGDKKTSKAFRCYTNSASCSGVAYFQNTNAKGIGCTIWKNNGAGGRVNFTLGPGESTAYNVIYNDTYSCVWIEYAPPEPNVQRYYIGVS